MALLGLSAGEFIALLGVLGGLITALYLLDRQRQKKVVSTLRFWMPADSSKQRRHRKRVQEFWSLVLQLSALALLLLAIARLEWGTQRSHRDHILLLDTSAWTAELSNGRALLDREKAAGREYIQRLPPSDRVLLVRVDSLFTPVTPFTSEKARMNRAIDASTTRSQALNLNHALSLAAGALRTSSHPGEIVYVGPGMTSTLPTDASIPQNLRVILLPINHENCGIRHIVAQRSDRDPRIWQVSVNVKNYGAIPKQIRVRAEFSGNALAPQTLSLGPNQQQLAEFAFQTGAPTVREGISASTGGRFTAAIEPDDNLPIDDHASLDLPPSSQVRVSVFTERPDAFKPLFDGDPRLSIAYYKPAGYRPGVAGGVVVFDQCAPESRPPASALWINPPLDQSPLPVSSVAHETEIVNWHSNAPLASGLNERNLPLPQASIFQTFEGDIPVASAPAGPVVVARPASPGRPKHAVIGFDPFAKALKFHVTTPLLLANLLHWLAPAAFGASEVEMARTQVAGSQWNPPLRVALGLPPRPLVHGPIVLWKWLALIAAAVLAIEWMRFGQSKSGRFRLSVKLASFAVIASALFAPALRVPKTRVAAAVLVDTSASIDHDESARAASIATQIAQHRRGNWMKVIHFGSADATNLEAALLAGAASLPENYVPRLVLISDGNENQGSLNRAKAELAPLQIGVDTIPLAAHTARALRLISVSMPDHAYAGEPIPIDLQLDSRESGPGTVQLWADGKALGGYPVKLAKGSNRIRLQARVNSTGTTAISGRLSINQDDLSFTRAIELRRARVLYLSGDPPGAGNNLIAALRAAGFEITSGQPFRLPPPFEAASSRPAPFQLLILNNVDPDSFTPQEKSQIESYVNNGGGLLLIGGDREIYHPHKTMDALDRVLPAGLAPPKGADGTAVALIIDKSSSMEGRKIELARMSAIGVVDHLRPTDVIGVLMFDNSFQWAVPMHPAEDKSEINHLIAGITPDGGTQIAPALGEAYRKVLGTKAAYKHILLLTDGISEEGDSFELAQNALANHVTISTIGLGQDVNRSYLEKIAAISGGHSYFLNQPQGLEQIALKDVKKYTGSSAIEKPLRPVLEHPAEILEGTGIETAPPLKGYSRFLAKPDADVVLSINDEKHDPLYVRWQYGLGRAAVFTSDAKSRWAQSWITWPGFDKFWINVARDLLKEPDRNADASFDSADGAISVHYHLPSDAREPAVLPEIFALGPAGFKEPVTLEKIAPRIYDARIYAGAATGLFRIRPLDDAGALPEIGLYIGEREVNDSGTNEPLLSDISRATGGHYNPPPETIFDPGRRFVFARLELWPGLLALAIALSITELVMRKWRSIRLFRERFSHLMPRHPLIEQRVDTAERVSHTKKVAYHGFAQETASAYFDN